jgi:hypothetical protein
VAYAAPGADAGVAQSEVDRAAEQLPQAVKRSPQDGPSDAPVLGTGGCVPSALLLQTTFSGFAGFGDLQISWGGEILADSAYAYGLNDLLAGSPRALALAKPAHHDLVLAGFYSYLGIGLGIAATAMPVGAFLLQQNPSRDESTAIIVSSLVGGLLGTLSTIIGSHYKIRGFKSETDAVNAYNEDLLTGRLKVPRARHDAASAKLREEGKAP